MKILVLYFSGTGNSKAVAEAYYDALEKRGHDVLIYSIEEHVTLPPHDCLVVGGPIYASNVPLLLLKHLKKHIKRANKAELKPKAIVFSTSAVLGNAYGVLAVSRLLESKGYQIIDNKTFVMPRNYYLERFEPTPYEAQIDQINSVAPLIWQSIESLHMHACAYEPKNVMGINLFAKVFRSMTRRMGKHYTIDESCIHCGKCAKNCPVSNINFEAQCFSNDCIMCTRCIHNCPANAIRYKGVKIEQYQLPQQITL